MVEARGGIKKAWKQQGREERGGGGERERKMRGGGGNPITETGGQEGNEEGGGCSVGAGGHTWATGILLFTRHIRKEAEEPSREFSYVWKSKTTKCRFRLFEIPFSHVWQRGSRKVLFFLGGWGEGEVVVGIHT